MPSSATRLTFGTSRAEPSLRLHGGILERRPHVQRTQSGKNKSGGERFAAQAPLPQPRGDFGDLPLAFGRVSSLPGGSVGPERDVVEESQRKRHGVVRSASVAVVKEFQRNPSNSSLG